MTLALVVTFDDCSAASPDKAWPMRGAHTGQNVGNQGAWPGRQGRPRPALVMRVACVLLAHGLDLSRVQCGHSGLRALSALVCTHFNDINFCSFRLPVQSAVELLLGAATATPTDIVASSVRYNEP